MATVTVITGLSGSGKSEYLNQMVDVIPFNEEVRPDKPENIEKFLDALEKQGQANFFGILLFRE